MALGLNSYRPLVGGVSHMISTGHYLATAAGYRILEQGGNAIDAGVAAGIVINVTLPQYTSFGGVAPIIIHHAASGDTKEISGLGRWPAEASIDYFRREHNGDMPHGVMRTVTPAAPDAWLTALSRYGTMTFEQVVTPALELAGGGFPIPATLHRALVAGQRSSSGDNIILDEGDTSQWTSTMQIFYPKGRALGVGDLLVQSDLARTFQRMIDAERAAAGQGRESAIKAARDFFYKGDIAEEMVAFHRSQGGWLSMRDLADFSVGVDDPPMIDYKGPNSSEIAVYACGPWCQGPMNLHALRILEGCDLQSMGHNSADYIHTVLEALKLAFADRHAYYGDPDFVNVPMDGLLSREYADLRRREIDPHRANPEMPDAGDPWPHQVGLDSRDQSRGAGKPEAVAGPLSADTSYICAVDRWGNAFSATPSDGFGGAPIIPGLGFMASARGAQNWLDEDHPSSLAPGKRPRLTPNPALAFKDGRPWLPFGTPGGDVQPQSMVQLFLNVAEFGMNVQQAIEQPRASTWSFPNSFWPHAYRPGLVGVESRIDPSVVDELRKRGHDVDVWNEWTPRMGSLCAIEIDRERGALFGGADLRRDGYAMGR